MEVEEELRESEQQAEELHELRGRCITDEERLAAMERRADLLDDERAALQQALDSQAPELERWRTRFEGRVDGATQCEGVMASALVSESLVSPPAHACQPVAADDLLPERELSRLISEVYKEKAALDRVVEGGAPTGKTLTEFVGQKYLRKFGLKRLADENMHYLVESVRAPSAPPMHACTPMRIQRIHRCASS